MDPFELLKTDHQKVSTLFEQIGSASGDAKMRIFRQLKQELDIHTHIEETIFYPALEREKQTREITLEAYEEHRVVKDLLAQLDAAASADDGWDARLSVLKENVEHHVEEEEGELFDKASDVLTGGQADELGDQMQAEKTRQLGDVPAQARQAYAPRRAAKATKKAAAKKSPGKTAKKSAGKATKKSAAKRSGASKSARKTPAKRATKSTNKPSNKAKKRSTKR